MPASSSSPVFRENSTAARLLPAGPGRYAWEVREGFAEASTKALASELFLYQQPAQLGANPSSATELLATLTDADSGLIVGWWPLRLAPDGRAVSLDQAPFGGPDLLSSAVPLAVVRAWIAATEGEMRARGARHCMLRLPALAYAPPAIARVAEALRLSGYRTVLAEVNNHLPFAEAYETRLHPSERRRLHKCQRHGMRVEQEPRLLLPLAYAFMRRCREEKGQALSLSEAQLTELFQRFPNNYFLFSVRDAAGEWAAMTVAVLVGNGVLYNFYPASPLHLNAFSPVVLLNAGLHAFGQASGLRLLDLGTSTLPTGLNESLLRFKRHLGGVPSLKLTLEKTL
ncbi:GNAT family N-acetyltransferase [Hymenobacter busanensis]|uniref:GNAT family N-acetyltransferase n=1 Tax=Hymenobacter busanensis TaxID=2607656 RepID=UPI0013677A7F|nr:GNAT family N-acetyltransferase [Hymenobacter busanensis]QHJ06633.1 GNAT family N-acetyltransferase [Hymenobacter busanensis]